MDEETRKLIQSLIDDPEVSDSYKEKLKATPGFAVKKGDKMAQKLLELLGKKKDKKAKTKEEKEELEDDDEDDEDDDEGTTKKKTKTKEPAADTSDKARMAKMEADLAEYHKKDDDAAVRKELTKALKEAGYDPEKVLSSPFIKYGDFIKVEAKDGSKEITGIPAFVKLVNDSGTIAKADKTVKSSDIFSSVEYKSDYKPTEQTDEGKTMVDEYLKTIHPEKK